MRRLHDYIASLPVEADGFTKLIDFEALRVACRVKSPEQVCVILRRAKLEEWLTVERVHGYRFRLDPVVSAPAEGEAA